MARRQLGAAAALLAAVGLLVQSAFALRAIDPGFATGRLLTARIELTTSFYQAAERRIAFWRDIVAQASRPPGVEAAAAVSQLPLDGGVRAHRIEVTGRPAGTEDGGHDMKLATVSAGYLDTLGVRCLAGRVISEQDDWHATPVAVVNDTLARAIWGSDAQAVQARLRIDGGEWRTIVGVVANVRQTPTEPPAGEVYVPLAQAPVPAASVLLRTAGEPLDAAPGLRDVVRSRDPNLPVSDLWTMDAIAASYFPAPIAAAFGALAFVALLLGGLGVFGVLAFLVASRTHEFGIRAALGAGRWRLTALVLRDGLRLVAEGLVPGVAGAMLLGLALSRAVPDLRAVDAAVLAGVAAVLAITGTVAWLLPGWRATRVRPAAALQAE